MGLEVVVSGEDFCADQFLLKDVHEVQKVFRAVVADVVYGVWRDGKAVLAVFLSGAPCITLLTPSTISST